MKHCICLVASMRAKQKSCFNYGYFIVHVCLLLALVLRRVLCPFEFCNYLSNDDCEYWFGPSSGVSYSLCHWLICNL